MKSSANGKEKVNPPAPGVLRLHAEEAAFYGPDGRLALSPKAYALLLELARAPGRLVSKQVLLDAVWPRVEVSEAVLKTAIREIRHALDEDADAPRYIETQPRRGYRLICEVETIDGPAPGPVAPATPKRASAPAARHIALPGRDADLEWMSSRLDGAFAGGPRVSVLVAPPGMGKTHLVRGFMERLVARGDLHVALGRCVHQFGPAEPFLPWLDVLEQVATWPDGAAALRRDAPSWIAEVSSLRDSAPASGLAATRERRLRELVALARSLARTRPLVLVIEDVHWADPGSLNALSMLAQIDPGVPLAIFLTTRDVDNIEPGHPSPVLRGEWVAHGLAKERVLAPLAVDAIATLTADHEHRREPTPRLLGFLQSRCGGNPLFLLNVVSSLEQQGALVVRDERLDLADHVRELPAVPDSLRPLLRQRLATLPPFALDVLGVASIAGFHFTSAAVAAALERPAAEIEACCADLARPGGIIEAGVDSKGVHGYRFVHTLYRMTLFDQLEPLYLVRWGRRLGEHVEHEAGEDWLSRAPKLARYFALAQDDVRVVRYLQQGARNLLRGGALDEALAYVDRAEEAAARLPPADRSRAHRVHLRLRAIAQTAAGDPAGAVATCNRWSELAEAARDPGDMLTAAHTRFLAMVRLDRAAILAALEQLGANVLRIEDPQLRSLAEALLGFWKLRLCCWDDVAAAAVERQLAATAAAPDYRVLTAAGYADCVRGDYARSAERAMQACALAAREGDVFVYFMCRTYTLFSEIHAGSFDAAASHVVELVDLGQRCGFPAAKYIARMFWSLFLIESGETALAREVAVPLRRATAADPAARIDGVLSRILLLRAALADGEEENTALLDECRALAEAEQGVVDPPLLPLLQLTVGAALLRWRGADAARPYVERGRDLAGACGEPTYRALARALEAACAYARRDFEEAGRLASAARGYLEHGAGVVMAPATLDALAAIDASAASEAQALRASLAGKAARLKPIVAAAFVGGA